MVKSRLNRYFTDHIAGIHYAARICIGTTILWPLLQYLHVNNPVWALVSLIVVTEPQMRPAWLAFRARIINTLIGSAIGLVFLLMLGPQIWLLTPALTVSALISSYLSRGQQGWRIAPVTTALVVSAALADPAAHHLLAIPLQRTMEVLLGSTMALVVTATLARVWLPPETTPAGHARAAAERK